MVPKLCRSARARQPVRRPRNSSWITSGRLASLRLPLIAISATPRRCGRRRRASPRRSSPGFGHRLAGATMPLDPGGRPPGGFGAGASSTSRASATDGHHALGFGRVQHPLKQPVYRTHRFGRPGAEIVHQLGVRSAQFSLDGLARAPGAAFPDRARADRRPGHPRAGSGDGPLHRSAPRAAQLKVKIIWRPDSIRKLNRTNSSSWVRSLSARRCTSSSRKAAAVRYRARQAPTALRSIASMSSLVNSWALRQATGPLPRGRESVAERVKQMGLAHAAGAHDDERVVADGGLPATTPAPPAAPCDCRRPRPDHPASRAARVPVADGRPGGHAG